MNREDRFDYRSHINDLVRQLLEKEGSEQEPKDACLDLMIKDCPGDSSQDRDEEYEEWMSDRDYWMEELGEDIYTPAGA